MNIIVCKTKKEVAQTVAEFILNAVEKKPSTTLGFATGKTMSPIYRKIVSGARSRKISFSKVRTFNLDEYAGINNKKESMRNFMEKNLFSKLDFNSKNINFLNWKTKDFNKECKDYEKNIVSAKIDIQLLGIGKNSHIAFNEPNSSFNSKTRVVKLAESTRQANASEFSKRVPKKAMTIGLSTIMKSKKIILAAFGESKSKAIKNSLAKISIRFPASVLQKHPNTVFVLDKKANGAKNL